MEPQRKHRAGLSPPRRPPSGVTSASSADERHANCSDKIKNKLEKRTPLLSGEGKEGYVNLVKYHLKASWAFLDDLEAVKFDREDIRVENPWRVRKFERMV